MTNAYSDELDLALRAVHRASIATKKMQFQSDKGASDKSDASPVTVADFAAQALMICAIHAQYPEDNFVAEESSELLRENPELGDRVWDLVQSMRGYRTGNNDAEMPLPDSKDQMMKLIDLGAISDGAGKNGRLWIMDPVDGTKTFMSGNQYAVCLCLVHDGQQMVAVLGAPNMLVEDGRVGEDLVDKAGKGIIVGAVAEHGAFRVPTDKFLDESARSKLQLPPVNRSKSELRFTDSAASSHVSLDHHLEVYEDFEQHGLPKRDIWAMQVKYIALALGAADASFRIPKQRSYRAAVWDHAGGQLILEEAGGKVTDLRGERFDFASGRHFKDNWGFVVAAKDIHGMVFDEVQNALKDYRSR